MKCFMPLTRLTANCFGNSSLMPVVMPPQAPTWSKAGNMSSSLPAGEESSAPNQAIPSSLSPCQTEGLDVLHKMLITSHLNVVDWASPAINALLRLSTHFLFLSQNNLIVL